MQRTASRWVEEFSNYWHKHPAIARIFGAGWVLVLGSIVFLWNLGSIGLVDETEPLFAEAARLMLKTGDWITPFYNGEPRFDKPPLIYWLMAIAYRIVGVNEWGARLPSALSAIALMGMVFYTLARFGNPGGDRRTGGWLAAAIGAAVMALHPLVIVWGRTGVSDMLLTSCIGLALLSFFCGYAEGETDNDPSAEKQGFLPSGWYLAAYVFTGLAILTKGPVGVVLPGLVVAGFLVYVGSFWRVLREMRVLLGVAIVLAISLPWYGLATLANGEAFIDTFFGYHNVERFTSVVNRHWAPWYFYFVVVLVGILPWSAYLPLAIGRLQVWKRTYWQRQSRTEQLGLFALFWFAAVFLFFTIAVTKLPSYVLPLTPAVAILVALLWEATVVQQERLRGWRWTIGLNILLFLAIAVVLFFLPQWLATDTEQPDLPGIIIRSGLLTSGSIIAIATGIACLVLLGLRQVRWIWVVNLLGFLILFGAVLMPATFIMDAQRQLPLRQLSQTILQVQKPGEPLMMAGGRMPSVSFYTERTIVFARRAETLNDYLQKHAADKPSFLVLGYTAFLKDLDLRDYSPQVVQKLPPYELIRLTPPAAKP